MPHQPVTSPLTSPPGAFPQLSLGDGTYLVYLDAWRREITALDDRHIREVALGGPDTSTRLKTVWQVRFLPVADGQSAADVRHVVQRMERSDPRLHRND